MPYYGSFLVTQFLAPEALELLSLATQEIRVLYLSEPQ